MSRRGDNERPAMSLSNPVASTRDNKRHEGKCRADALFSKRTTSDDRPSGAGKRRTSS